MLDIKIIREQPELVKKSIKARHLDPQKANVDYLLELDRTWREVQGKSDTLRAERNRLSDNIKTLSQDEKKVAIAKVKDLKIELADLENKLLSINDEREQLLRQLPNLLDENVPVGHTDEDNVEISRWGDPKNFSFEPRNHVELGKITDTIDFDRGAKVTGSNFYYLKNEAALLEQALCAFAANRLISKGFIPISTPDLARDHILEGIGFAPRGPETQVYSIVDQDICLVGTAEITVGGYHSDEILEPNILPLRYLGFSHCFRTEAGAHGKESKGLYRVHQFTKAEMFILCCPNEAANLHEELRQHEESLLQELQIPYRVVNVCSGDLGAPAAKKYDIEAWLPGRNNFGEVTSCSNCTDYQARRLNIRYRPEPKAPPRFVYMLNGTAIAISRTLIAIYENYQEQNGSITIPKVLRPWMGNISHIPVRL